MARVVGPPARDRGTIYFELEQLEVSGQRLELRGRWYGVRGRRFMRPTLTLRSGLGPRRLLADLEQKPWTAEEAELWLAVFPWELDSQAVSDLELSVSPDIAVELPVPGGMQAARQIQTERESLVRTKSEPIDVESVSRKLAEEQHRNQLLRAQVDELREAQVQANAATARRDAALSALEVAGRERTAAVAELERARAEFDQAVAQARAEREDAIEACQVARSETAQARSERGAALRAAERAASEKETAVRQLAHVERSRDEALRTAEGTRREMAQIQGERDDADAALELARRERAEAMRTASHATRDREKAMRDREKSSRERDKAVHTAEQVRAEAARTPAFAGPPVRTFTPRRTYRVASARLWAGRALALIVLLAILVAVAVIVKIV
jgi:hypothetical protein